jgi:hypothetical protein
MADLDDLSVAVAREIVVRAQQRMEQLEKIRRREGLDPDRMKCAQVAIGKAATITARDSREGRVARRDLRAAVDLNTLRIAGTDRERPSPLFAVFGQGLCDSVARVMNSDSIAERITEIEKVMGSIELEEDHAILRKLHHELRKLRYRTQQAEKRTTRSCR